MCSCSWYQGELVFPLGFVLWLPKSHADDRSKNDSIRDEITELKATCDAHEVSLEEGELLGDSAYCRQKVVLTALNAGLRVITTPGPIHVSSKGRNSRPKKIIERVKGRQWQVLEAATVYQRVVVSHHTYGEVVLIVRRRRLKNQKVLYDVLLCTTRFYTAPRIHRSSTTRGGLSLSSNMTSTIGDWGKGSLGNWGRFGLNWPVWPWLAYWWPCFVANVPEIPVFGRRSD